MYDWRTVAERTEIVYDTIAETETEPLLRRFSRYYSCGALAGKIFCFLISMFFLWWTFIDWWYPQEEIDLAVTFPHAEYRKSRSNQQISTTTTPIR